MSNDAVATIEAWARSLEQLGQVPATLAARAAPAVRFAVEQQISAGTTPEGAAWAPTQRGNPPLAHAAGDLTVASSAGGLRLSLSGPSAFHSQGLGRSPRRQILPDSGELPDTYKRAVDDALRDMIAEAKR